jgi:hypothetical protein
MLTLKDFMEAVNYRITESSAYCWHCYGSNAFTMDSWDGNHEGHSVSVTFDTKTQEVYSMEAYDYQRERAYRLINPAYLQAFTDEVKARGLNDEAWDGIQYTTLETDEDMLAKMRAIVAGEDYDTRVKVPVEMDEADLMKLFKLAHEADVTFNEFVGALLHDVLTNEKFRNKANEVS